MKEINRPKLISIEKCPYCYGTKIIKLGILPQTSFSYSNYRIKTDQEIEILQCRNCGLFFKSIIPSKLFLSEISVSSEDETWSYTKYNYSREYTLISSLDINPKGSAILDVGAYTGSFLKAMDKLFAVKSALDIIEFPPAKKLLNGEYLLGYLDDNSIKSDQKYDVITMFDVLEHCYDLRKSLLNCIDLLKKNGYLIIETGDAASKTPSKFGVNNWWYFNLFVHHITIGKESLLAILNEMGFKILKSFNRIHKSKIDIGLKNLMVDYLKYKTFETLSPSQYYKLVSRLGLQKFPPANPLEKDHMFIVAQLK